MVGELSQAQIEDLLHRELIGRIGCHTEGRTYVVPIAYAYDGRYVYAHSGEGRKVAVPTVVLGDVLREFGCPHYLKIDIEGHDLLALRQLEESGCRPSFVSVENGEPPMLETLVRMGYAGFKFINQATVPKLRLPLRAREGRRIGHRFPFGATGPFGEETPGTWRSAEDIECEIRAYWERPGRDAAVHGWYDLHARHGRVPLPNNGVLNISKWIRK